MLMGVIVDGVSEVLNLTAAEIEDTPDFGDERRPVLARHGEGEGQGQDSAGYRPGALEPGPAPSQRNDALVPTAEKKRMKQRTLTFGVKLGISTGILGS